MKFIYQVLFVLAFINIGKAQDQMLVEYAFRVEGMCGMCKDRIEEVAQKNGGIKPNWDVGTKILSLTVDENKTKISHVKYAIAQAGHDNGPFVAPDEVYAEMHHCCRYRPEEEIPDAGAHLNAFEDVAPAEKHSHFIEGVVFTFDDNGQKIPLIGANVALIDGGVGTTTDNAGRFSLDNSQSHANAIKITYIGFKDQVVTLDQDGILEITLQDGHKLDEVEIVYKQRTTEVSFIKPINSENITREELCKAACCNLSESFETNPSVDVSFPDAVTGTRQIQMLGLAGPYVQITRELIPDVRAMSSIYGLSMTPGPWIESIQLIKGAGSVVNGFESMIGQINVELKKPERGERLFLNGYVNSGGRVELNANMRFDVDENIKSGILFHAKRLRGVHDNNGDGFTDMPLENDFIVANRWKFNRVNNFEGQLGVKVSRQNHEGGYHDHFSGASLDHENHWRMNNLTNRVEVWGKLGYVNPASPKNSVGLQMSALYHDQEAQFGNTVNDATQKSYFANLIFQRIPNDNHVIRTGISYQLDNITEFNGKAGLFERYESVPGIYFEYTFKTNKLSIIPGIRSDWHNNYGQFFTPRLHAKYNLAEKSIIRVSAGRGLKTASIFAENLGLFSTSRNVVINQANENNPYGLDPEIVWNYGINYAQGLDVFEKELIISIDIYRTQFENQIVVDYENPRLVQFYNLQGESYSNSFQIKFEYPLLRNLDIRTAYRMFDVKTTFGDQLLRKPMVSKHRAFINMAYKTDNDWHFDATLNWNGQKRLPSTIDNPQEFRRLENSPNYFLLNAQIMKRWGTKWDVYIGAENLLNYKQTDAIIAGDDAFGKYFDASIVWAPLFGTNIYVGFRYNLN